MQPKFANRNGFQNTPANVERRSLALARQRELIRLAKENQLPILLVEYRRHGSTERVLRDEIGNYPHVYRFRKNTDGIFESGGNGGRAFRTFMERQAIDELFICGANGGACVRESIAGALDNGLTVWIDPEGVIDFNDYRFTYPYSFKERHLRLRNEDNRINLNEVEDLGDIAAAMNRAMPSTEQTYSEQTICGRILDRSQRFLVDLKEWILR